MRARTLSLQLLLAVACVALGIVLDRQVFVPRRKAAAVTNALAIVESTQPTNKLFRAHPIVPPESENNDTNEVKKFTTLAEISDAIEPALTNRLFSERGEALKQVAQGADLELIPDALGLIEKIPAGPLRNLFQSEEHTSEL